MPQQREKTKKVETAPSPGLLQRFLGAFQSTPMSPEMEEGVRIARAENPNLAPVQTFGPLSRLLKSDAQAYASPGRTIYMNPEAMAGQTPQDVADTLMHEQEHVRQMQEAGTNPFTEFFREIRSGINEPYHRRPDEMAAFQVEKERRARMGRMPAVTPSFETGEMQQPRGDIFLSSPKKKKINTGPSSQTLSKLVR